MCNQLIILNTIRGDLTELRRLLETETDNYLRSLSNLEGPAFQDYSDFEPNVIKLLRNAGAFVDDRVYESLLHVAVAANNIESLKLLIEIGYDVNSYNKRYESVLHCAVANECYEIVELLVEKGADINEEKPKESALSCAVRIHNEPLTTFLLDHGADVNIENSNGSSPLMYAAKCHSPMITIMIMIRADINMIKSFRLNFGTYYFSFFLFLEILLNNSIGRISLDGDGHENIKYLMEREAKSDKSRFVKARALHYALTVGDCRTVKFLSDYGAEISDLFDSYTALHFAATNRCDDMVNHLLDSGNDVNARNKKNVTPLHIAASRGRDRVCKILLSRGADVNLLDDWGNKPLYTAVQNHHPTTVKILLEYGADVCSKCLSNDVFMRLAKSKCEIISNILIERIAKLVSLNSWDDEKVLKTIARDDGMKCYYEKCKDELEKMKIWKVYENVCLFNILKEKGMTSGYARNEDLIEVFDNAESQLNHDFPIYYSLLKKDFYKEIKKQRLIKGAAIVLSEIFNFNNPFHIVNLKILSYLSEEDIIKINEDK